jgi:hypothetical protein
MSDPQEFEYLLLGRLQFDCYSYLNRLSSATHLWAGNIKDQIAKMKELWNELKIKPEWITLEEIERYEQQMNAYKHTH